MTPMQQAVPKLKSKLECKLEFLKLVTGAAVLKKVRWYHARSIAEDLRDLSCDDMAARIMDGVAALPNTPTQMFATLWASHDCDADRTGAYGPDELSNREDLLEMAQDAKNEVEGIV